VIRERRPRRFYAKLNDCPVTGKRSFSSAQAVRAFNRSNPKKIRPYKCEHCYRWHGSSRT
jgi:hypothetical protein